MLRVSIPACEKWDEAREEFVTIKAQALSLEHSLVSLAKWESKWHKAFLGKQPKTGEETLDYIRCMTLTQNVDPNVYRCIPPDVIEKVYDYIQEPMTAVYFPDEGERAHGGDTPTAELFYYWMISLNIPFECQKWHLNRLWALIRVCSKKNEAANGGKKMGTAEIQRRNRELNAARRRRMNTKG